MAANESLKPIQWFIGFLGVVGTVSGMALLPPFPGSVVVFSGLAVAGACSLGLAAWRQVTNRRLIEIRTDLSGPEFDLSCALGHRIYSNHLHKAYPSREQIDAWLTRYGKGVVQAYDRDHKLWGYFSLFPISHEAFRHLKSGEIGEGELDAMMVCAAEHAPFTYWYIADILKDNHSFHKSVPNTAFSEYLKPLMIHGCLHHLHAARQFTETFELIGLAVSRPGERLLRHDFQFERVLPISPHSPQHKIYVKAFHAKNLKRLMSKMRRRIDHRERQITRTLAQATT